MFEQVRPFVTPAASVACMDDVPVSSEPPAAAGPGQRRLLVHTASSAIALIRDFCPTNLQLWLTPEMTVVEAESILLRALRHAVGVEPAVTFSLPLYLRLAGEWLSRDMQGALKDLHIKQPWKLTYALNKPSVPAGERFKAQACITIRRMAEQLQCGGI